MINFKEENKKIVEKDRYSYYDFTEEKIKLIVSKNVNEVTNEEWRMLIQMLYPKSMIGSGLFQPILIFSINKNGKRIDPPKEAYNNITDLKENSCLFFRIIDYIEKNSNLKINNSWYKAKESILKKGDKTCL